MNGDILSGEAALPFSFVFCVPPECRGGMKVGGEWGWGGVNSLTLLHSERPKLYTILAFLSAIGLRKEFVQIYSLRSKFFPKE